MKVAILGFGSQGRAAYEYWSAKGDEITVCDRAQPDGLPADLATRIGDDYLKGLDAFDLIVRSPSIHPRDIVAANSPEILQKVTTVTDEFLRVCPTKNTIGVTGTKGKGTTSSLIARMLEADGKRVHLGGNIGIPPLDLLKNDIRPDDWVVLELANFQLIDLTVSPHIAVCLMVAPEHLDWHPDIKEYYQAKSQLFAHQATDDIAIYYAANDDSKRIAESGPGRKLPFMTEPGAVVSDENIVIDGQVVVNVNELKLLGRHNWQNACAAVTAVWQVTQNVEAIRSVLTSFTGLEHRLEFVRELDGVKYYDDSFGTTPETAIVAMQAFAQPKVIILGGSDKGASYDELARTVVGSNVRHALLIGDQAERIRQSLDAAGYHDHGHGGDNMTEIVDNARSQAQSGDIVLLSTGCASFGMFKNYKDRGEQFANAVRALS